MKRHKLKTDPHLFSKVRAGFKTAEIRKDDRNFRVGDILILYPFDREKGERTSPDFCCREITHKVSGGQYGIEPGYCLLSMK
jgi:hypothetical protein